MYFLFITSTLKLQSITHKLNNIEIEICKFIFN